MTLQTQRRHSAVGGSLRGCGLAFLLLLVACTHQEQIYTPDPNQLKEVQTKVMEGSIETPTLGDPIIALTDHEAFVLSYFGQKGEVVAAAMHRLADLYLILENRSYQQEVAVYTQRLRLYQQGRLKKLPLLPLAPYSRSLKIYEKLLEDYPNRPENDRVLYQLARIYESNERPDRRDEMFKRLLVQYPNSRYAPEVQFRLADSYFAAGKYREAAAAYKAAAGAADFSILERGRKGAVERAEIAIAEAKKREEEEGALYKSGWTLIALEDYRAAIDTFRTLLDRKRKILVGRSIQLDPKFMSAGEWDFVQEVLRGMVVAFSYWGPPTNLQRYFESIGHRDYEYLIYRKLGDLYQSQKLIYDAIKVYEAFLKVYPLHPESPNLALAIVEAYQRLQLVDLSNSARIQFLENFGEGSSWFKNAAAEDHAKVAPFLKQMTHQLALFYHSEAQKTRRPKDYERAVQWYRRFLTAYPTEAESGRMNFLLAEGLYELGKAEEAVAEYEKAAYEYPLHQDSAESGYAAIVVMDKIWTSTAKAGAAKNSPLALRLAQACVRYAKAFPTDDRVLDVLLKGADIYFQARHFEQARNLAEEITRTHLATRSPMALKAQRMIANSYFEEGAYVQAAEIYRQLNMGDVTEAEREEVKRLWASALYKQAEEFKDAGKLKEAEAAFYQVQREVPASEVAPVALYDAGLITLEGGDLTAALQAFGLLIQQYPKAVVSEKVPALLLQTQQQFLAQNHYTDAQVLADGFENLGTGMDKHLAYQAQRMIANSYFEEGAYVQAAEIYRQLNMGDVTEAEREEVKRLWASALYKQAEEFKDAGKLKEAEAAFYQVQREVPASEVAPVALYDAGLITLEGGDLTAALQAFGLLVGQYPKASHAVHAALRMARIHEQQGKLKESAEEYQKVSALTKDRAMAAGAILAAGLLYEQLGDWPKVESLYMSYLEGYAGEFEKVVEIRYKLIEVKQRLGLHAQAKDLLQRFIKQYSSTPEGSSRVSYYLSKAHLSSARYLREQYDAVKLVLPLEDNLARKRRLLAEVLDLYIQAAEYKISEVATEATYQIGKALQEFRTALIESERPQGLTPQQLEQYNFLLEEQAYPYEERAIVAYESNVRRAQELGLYDSWVKQSYVDLARLIPGRYQKPELKEVVSQKLIYTP